MHETLMHKFLLCLPVQPLLLPGGKGDGCQAGAIHVDDVDFLAVLFRVRTDPIKSQFRPVRRYAQGVSN